LTSQPGGVILDRTEGRGWPEHDSKDTTTGTGQPWKDIQDRTELGRTTEAGQQGKTDGTGQSEELGLALQVSRNRLARAGQKGERGLNTTATTGQLG
jgi:hypothetical protein